MKLAEVLQWVPSMMLVSAILFFRHSIAYKYENISNVRENYLYMTHPPTIDIYVSRNEYKLFYFCAKIKWRRPSFRGASTTPQAMVLRLMNKL